VPRTEPGLIARWITEFVDEVEAGEAIGSRAPWVRGGGLDQLRGRLALVTGAASGIGRATAAALAQRGARVLLVDRDGRALQSAESEMGAAGTFVCDVSDERAMERLCDHVVGRFGVPTCSSTTPALAWRVRCWRRVRGSGGG
jgi:NADPH:quinone reductase-like Zn-dependent oxidoreductase